MKKKRHYLFLGLLMLLITPVVAQKNGIHQFNRSNGFENAFVYQIQQTPRGYITISTNYGFFSYDGNGFNAIRFSENSTTTRSLSHQVLNDDSIYIGLEESLVLYNLTTSKILKSWRTSDYAIKKITIDQFKNVWILNGNNEIYLLNKQNNQLELYYKLNDNLIYDFLVLNKNEIYMSTSIGLQSLIQQKIVAIPTSLNSELSLTRFNENSIYIQEKNRSNCLIYNIKDKSIDYQKSANDENGYISAPFQEKKNKVIFYHNKNGISEIEYHTKNKNISEKNEQNANESIGHKINVIFLDKESNYWLGSLGGGIYKIDYNPFHSKIIFKDNMANIQSICAINDNMALIGTSIGLKLALIDKENNIITIEDLPFKKSVQKIFKLSSGKIYLKCDLEIYEFKDGTTQLVNFGEEWKKSSDLNDIYESKKGKYLCTNDGIFLQPNDNSIEIRLTTSELLLHNSVYKVIENKIGELWIISPYTLPYAIKDDKVKKINQQFIQNTFFDPISLQLDEKDNLWFGTKGDGIFKYNAKSLTPFNKDNGLINNAVLNIQTNKKNKFWIIHESGVSIIKNHLDQISLLKTIAFPDEFEASQMQQNAPCFGSFGSLFFHNQSSLYYLYDTTGYDNNQVLNLFIKKIKINNEIVENNENSIQLPHGYYRLELEFKTIYLQKPSMVKYAYRILGGEDTMWIEKRYTESELILPNLTDGSYIIQLKSYLSDESQSSKIITYEIDIASAIYKKWWFWVIMLLLSVSIIVGYIQLRLKKIKKDKIALEQLIRKRTFELEKEKNNLKAAKDIIEQKTNAITESIEYARKIQVSSLPALENLGDKINQLMVYSRPKDIVSGDFYWFKRSGNQLLLALFDCTGHGVPAGFISMIGVNLISKIVNEGHFNNPAEVLNQLNNLLLKELNPETEIELYNTAMDAAVVFIDFEKLELTFSGASRPIAIVSENVVQLLKGNIMSIGGYNSKIKEPFENKKCTLKPDDMVYLFSDGYADQFNPGTKKRFFNNQLLELFSGISTLSISEQQAALDYEFLKWKKNAAQTDDILVLGFKI